MPARTHSDEPTADDLLERKKYAQGLARLAESGATPMVIGIYGTWGMGKTSLMRLIEMELDRTKVRPLWFNPWEHQFDDNPMVALVYKIMEQTGQKWEQTAKEKLALFAAALASGAVKSVTKYFTGLDFSIKNLLHLGRHYVENQFLVQDFRMKLRDKFEDLVKKVRTEGYAERRLVFFIDDLDRCLDDQALKLLEALKLYLNLEGCVFFLGLNREAMEASLRRHYPDLDSQADYLDKIIQLPFHLPPIDSNNRKQFVGRLLGQELASCGDLLAKTLGENPRKVKRFINKLIVNDSLAQALAIRDYDVRVLALILLIQDAHYPFYMKIAEKPDRLKELQQDNQDEETEALAKQFLDSNEPLRGIVRAFPVPDRADLAPYIHLVRVTRSEPEDKDNPISSVGKESDWQGQVKILEENVVQARNARDLDQLATILNTLGNAYLGLREPMKATQVLEESAALARNEGHLDQLATILNTLGTAYLAIREPIKAVAVLEESAVLARNAGDLHQLATILNTLGNAYLAIRESVKAVAVLEEGAALARNVGRLDQMAISLNTLGNTYLALGKLDEAAHVLEEAIKIDQDPGGLAMILNTLGNVYLKRGDSQAAINVLQQSLSLTEKSRGISTKAHSYNLLGQSYERLGQLPEAIAAYRAAESMTRSRRGNPQFAEKMARQADRLEGKLKKEG